MVTTPKAKSSTAPGSACSHIEVATPIIATTNHTAAAGGPGSACSHIEVVTPIIIATTNCSAASDNDHRVVAAPAPDTTAADCDTTSVALSTTPGSSSIINDSIYQQHYQVHDNNETLGRKSPSSGMRNEEQHNNNTNTPSVLRGGSDEEKCDDGTTTTKFLPSRPRRTSTTNSSATSSPPQKKNKTHDDEKQISMTPKVSSLSKHQQLPISNKDRTQSSSNANNNTPSLSSSSSLTTEETSSSLFHLLLESGGRGGGSSSLSSPSKQYFLWVSWDLINVEQKTSEGGCGNNGKGGGLSRVQVGDLMCIMDSTINSSTSAAAAAAAGAALVQQHHHTTTPLLSSTSNGNESSLSSNHHHHQPINNVPWKPCQILSIFRERIHNKLSSRTKHYGPILVEVRWFYRTSDIDDTASNSSSSSTSRGKQGYNNTTKTTKKKRMRDDVLHHDNNNNDGDNDNEVFETSNVVILPASFLLGKLVLRPTEERKACNYDDDDDDDSRMQQQTLVPAAAMVSCRRFYFHQGHEIVNILLDDVGGEKKNTVVSRGLECSKVLQNDHILKEITYTSLGYATPATTHDKVGMKVNLPSPILTTTSSAVHYASCTLAHPLTQLIHGNMMYPNMITSTTSFPRWEVCVGDIVAVHCDESTPPDEYSKSWYPYIVPWSHAQVMSIFIEGDNTNDDDDDMSRFSGGGGASVSTSKKQTPKKTKKTKQTSNTSASSMMTTSSSVVDATLVKVEVRWFPRVSEAILVSKGRDRELKRLKELSTNDDTQTPVEVILEGRQISIIDCISLLGPVSIVDIDGSTKVHTTPAPVYLPQNRRIICTSMTCDECGKPRFVSRLSNTTDPITRVERGINESLRYDKHQMKEVIDAVKRVRNERLHRTTMDLHNETLEIERQPSTGLDDSSQHGKRNLVEKDSVRSRKKLKSTTNDSSVVVNTPIGRAEAQTRGDRAVKDDRESNEVLSSTLRVSCNTDPYHVDVSALKSFYEDIDIIPPVDSYDTRYTSVVGGDMEKLDIWKVKLGDTVAVEIEQDTKVHNSKNFPFTVQWAPGEVVTIYRLHKTKASCALLRERVSEQKNDQKVKSAILQESHDDSDIMIEIRWLYRIWEIPGASKKKINSIDGELEEVFETDQLVVCSADSILSPVHLYDAAATSTNASKNVLGSMPNIHYHCSRFWSIHRRSFVPSGSLSNRVSRGRMHSAYKATFSKLESASSVTKIVEPTSNTSWKEEFQTAIQRLSLAEAAHDAQENGMVLSCRENERAQIITFVRKAISGLAQANKFDGSVDDEVKNLKSSLFIAGPPGTGKTASVRSIMAELQTEQHKGLLPEFNFIALNGMELRHPFDAYIKLWESISGTRKERLSAGDAVYELENYFCGDQSGTNAKSDSDDDSIRVHDAAYSKRPVTVLMLDEIDYLVTKKETLVYNFFDWPLRATTARLVVIGISNTINLPEKLSTRVQSRIGGERCHFRSYNVDDTTTILKTRLGMLGDYPNCPIFEEDAIKFAARKTANLSGDIRKAFHMCKVAAETVFEEYSSGKRLLDQDSRPMVRISDVQKGSRDMFTSIVLRAVSCSTDYEALLLISLGSLKRGQDDRSFQVKDILTKIESIANASGERRYMDARLSLADVLGIVNRLGDAGVIQVNTTMHSPFPYISTHLHSYEILASYRDTRHSKLAERHLANQRLF